MNLLDRLRGLLDGRPVDTTDRERKVKQIAQDSEAALREAQVALRKPPALIELRRLDSRRPSGRAT